MTATDILLRAIDEAVGETDHRGMEILEDAIHRAVPVIRTESLDAYNEGEDAGVFSAAVSVKK